MSNPTSPRSPISVPRTPPINGSTRYMNLRPRGIFGTGEERSSQYSPDGIPLRTTSNQHAIRSFKYLNGIDLSDKCRREKEEKEKSMTAEELRIVIRKERALSMRLATDLIALRDVAEASAIEAEADEECRINHLMRRLTTLQIEKGRIINELEREEELLTNNLMRRLESVQREKVALEEQIYASARETRLGSNTPGSSENVRTSGSGSIQI